MALLLAPESAVAFGNVYATPADRKQGSGGCELWRANYQAMADGAPTPMLVVDPGRILVHKGNEQLVHVLLQNTDDACSCFVVVFAAEMSVVDYLNERGAITTDQRKDELKGLHITFAPQLKHLHKQKRIVRDVQSTSGKTTFVNDEGQTVSVAEHFKTCSGLVCNTSLPVLCTRRPNPGATDPLKRNGVYFPLEACVVVGNQKKRRLEV